MESELSPDKEKDIPPVPIKTYQWEDVRRAREAGGYPWTHLLKPPIEGEITAEDIIRETTPRRSMSRELSRSRTHTPVDNDVQKILNLDASPGSSRKHGEEGEDEGVQIPNFSKEVSLDSAEDLIDKAVHNYVIQKDENFVHLMPAVVPPKHISPKGILKRRVPEQQYIGTTETREKTKCCHPLVNKIKHLADKTLHKLEKSENEKSPLTKRKKNEETQEIRQLRYSPGAVRRQKFSAIKLGDSDEMSKTMCVDTPPPRKKKDHIYEDIAESKSNNSDGSFLNESIQGETKNIDNIEQNIRLSEQKSIASDDPSLVGDEHVSLHNKEHVMEKLHNLDKVNKEAVLLDEDEPNIDEVFQNQLEETRNNDSPNITITEIIDEESEQNIEQCTTIPIESSPSPSPRTNGGKIDFDIGNREWSRPSSDHEYEIIEKPTSTIILNVDNVGDKTTLVKSDEMSSSTSLERKYFQHTSDEDEQMEDKENPFDGKCSSLLNAQALQKDMEDRYFVNTPSTISRTECDISTSQVDSSALENLPLKRDSRMKSSEHTDNKIQQQIKRGTGKIKSQAGKIKTKLQNIKTKPFHMPERPKFNFPDKPKLKMPERPKISLPERPKFTLPDKRKFSLPERPKFNNINFTQKLSFGDRKKFTLPERPKFNVPDFPKFKIPDKNIFSSLGRRKEPKRENNFVESNTEPINVAKVEFEAKTYPRLFKKMKKTVVTKTSSSPTLNREDTPPPTFTFSRVKKVKEKTSSSYIPDSPEYPREYGNIVPENIKQDEVIERKQYDARYDFDKIHSEYLDDETESPTFTKRNTVSTPDVSPSKQEYTHVINEINNDEFFVRPRGISRENIQVREYLSDEIRQAFKIPKNALTLITGASKDDNINIYMNDAEADPDLLVDENESRYSIEDLNEKDDGYYTFPPVRPSRAKRKKKESEKVKYIEDSVNASIQFSEVDLGLPEDTPTNEQFDENIVTDDQEFNDDFAAIDADEIGNNVCFHTTDLNSIHEYANDDIINYPEQVPVDSQTLPMPPKRKKKFGQKGLRHSSLNDFNCMQSPELWQTPQDDIIVYRIEHEYIPSGIIATEDSPVPPRRNRSRSSRGTSFCDDDRTSHGAESLTLDTNILSNDDREIRHVSPGYATVDKNPPNKGTRRSKSKTPPTRQRKSNSSERKYYTVASTKNYAPDRPPRKKSSTSLMTLNSLLKRSYSTDVTQYVEIDDPQLHDVQKNLNSGEVLSKMKDRPLPPPPRPPRGSRRNKKGRAHTVDPNNMNSDDNKQSSDTAEEVNLNDLAEIEVSTQTDPLPDDVDFELGIDDNIGISMNSLRDLIDEDSFISKSNRQTDLALQVSRPSSRSEKSIKISDPKISELSKSSLGRTSPTVILVERRVSSPTRINEREEMLTEASLTVQHINVDETQIPDVPPLPKSRTRTNSVKKTSLLKDEQPMEKLNDVNKEVQLDNLVTQRLQVSDLDVGRLNVSELQASKILVSDIEGMTLQVTELNSKSGHISVSGIEFPQSVIDEIVKKFAEISTNSLPINQINDSVSYTRPVSREEQTQTDNVTTEENSQSQNSEAVEHLETSSTTKPEEVEEISSAPQRPPPPDLSPLFYSYFQDLSAIPPSLYPSSGQLRQKSNVEYLDSQHQLPPPPTRRVKRKPTTPVTESSSDDGRSQPSSRRMPISVKSHEPTITEAGANFLRVCQNSISRTLRHIFNSFVSYISGTEDKKDVQMALVIFLVLVAGLIMFGLSDSRTIHHHHWEFFNPPDGKQ